MTTSPYVYRIKSLLRVVDGDSFWAYVDVGFRETKLIEVRLAGIDCPERNRGSAFERREALRARLMVMSWFEAIEDPEGVSGDRYWVRTEPDPDNFGRWLGHVWWERDNDSAVLADELLRKGLAARWPTRWFQVHDPERNMP